MRCRMLAIPAALGLSALLPAQQDVVKDVQVELQSGVVTASAGMVAVAGHGAGVKLGQNIVVPKGTPLCNLWLGLLHGMSVNVERHGDSTGPLKQAFA